jgi:hypothetical protein
MARSSLWTRLEAAQRKIPAPMPVLTVARWLVAPNPEVGGPPIQIGLCHRFTNNIPEPGYPTIDEVFWPCVIVAPPPITKVEAIQFYAVIGAKGQKQPRDVKQSDLVIWRNCPTGPAIARENNGEGQPEIVRPLWPAAISPQ